MRSFELRYVTTQKLRNEGIEDKKVIEKAILVLEHLVPRYTSSVASPSGKLKSLSKHITK